MVSAAALVLADYNPRTITPQVLASLRAGIREFGLVQPIVARRVDKLVVGGHQRLAAVLANAEEDGVGDVQVPVVWVDLTDAKAKALNLALNKISGDWDFEKLAILVDDLVLEELTPLTGFELSELEDIRAVMGSATPLPPPPADSAAGDAVNNEVAAVHMRTSVQFVRREDFDLVHSIAARFSPSRKQTPETFAEGLVRLCRAAQGVPGLVPEVVTETAKPKGANRSRKRASGGSKE